MKRGQGHEKSRADTYDEQPRHAGARMSEPGASEGAHREAVERAVAATTVLSPTGVRLVRRAPAGPGGAQRGGDGRHGGAGVPRACVQTRLYTSFTASAAAPTASTPRPPRLGPSPFVWALSQANRGSGSREPGWTVAAHEDGRVVVERNGLRLWVRPEDLHRDGGERARSPGALELGPYELNHDPGERAPSLDAVQVGAQVGVRMPKELRRLSPGFYMALGDDEFRPTRRRRRGSCASTGACTARARPPWSSGSPAP